MEDLKNKYLQVIIQYTSVPIFNMIGHFWLF